MTTSFKSRLAIFTGLTPMYTVVTGGQVVLGQHHRLTSNELLKVSFSLQPTHPGGLVQFPPMDYNQTNKISKNRSFTQAYACGHLGSIVLQNFNNLHM